MNYQPKINRRSFVIGSAAAGGLALVLDLPFGPSGALAQAGDRAAFNEVLTPNESASGSP